MPIDPVKIPANVQVEEKIVGPVSLRQILILMITGGFSYAIWSIVQKAGYTSLVAIVASFIPLYIGAAFAFVKVNDVSLLRLMFLEVEKLQKPTRRTFGPRRGISINIRTQSNKKRSIHSAQKKSSGNIEELSSLLDTSLSSLRKETAEEEQEPDEKKPVNPQRISTSDSDAPSIDSIHS